MNEEVPDLIAGQRDRVIGHYRGSAPGPTLIAVGGLHGNEPAGVAALERVIEFLNDRDMPMRGQLVALIGNVRALELNQRYIDQDLNRMWLAEAIEAARQEPAELLDNEQRQQLALLDVINEFADAAGSPVVFLDLHTTSSESAPFVCFGDTLAGRAVAQKFPVPLILGLEEQLDGTFNEFVSSIGHIGLIFEGGRHEDESSVGYHEAAVWTALTATGQINAASVPRADRFRELLAESAKGLPRVVEIRYRHGIDDGDGFRMRPGYENFHPLEPGEVVADDHTGPVSVTEGGRILLPLYQNIGNDGFFVCREISPAWLTLSGILRRLRLDAIMHWLPGVRKHPTRPHSLLIDTHVARWFPVEIFHLLGYRRRRPQDGRIVMSRR